MLFINNICRCLDAKPSCKIKKAGYSLTNNCYRRHNYYDYIGPGGKAIIIAVAARARKALIPSLSQDITMAPTNKDSNATRMTGAHMFQAVEHPELDTLGLVAIRDFLKKRADMSCLNLLQKIFVLDIEILA
jgi:hypothetical protein